MEDPTIIELIFELQKKCSAEIDKFIDDLGISQAEYNMFICLKNCKHFNSYSVADKMNLSLSRVSRIIDKMVSKGFLNRTTNKLDRRAIDIKITPKGKTVHNKIVLFIGEREENIVNQLKENEIEDMKNSFTKLINLS